MLQIRWNSGKGGGVTIIVCAIRMIRKRRMRETETACKDIK
jgi:hypothetical protein